MFDISAFKLVALALLAVLIFGPDKLPKLIADAMRILRMVREVSDKAKQEIREELGPEYQDFDFEDLNPKTFVRKQLAAHGAELGLNDLQDLKNGLTREATRATTTVRELRADPLAKVSGETPTDVSTTPTDAFSKGPTAPPTERAATASSPSTPASEPAAAALLLDADAT